MIHRIFSTFIVVSFLYIFGTQGIALASTQSSNNVLIAENSATDDAIGMRIYPK